jgi:hypothetical protein
MLKSQIKIGNQYAMREKRSPGASLQRVRVLEHIRGSKWRVEWIEPNPGLVHFVDSAELIVPWKERTAFLREEENERQLQEHNATSGFDEHSPVTRAIEQVFESAGDGLLFFRGVLTGAPEAVQRVRTRACLPADTPSLHGYVDRRGELRLPGDEALELARAFCAQEPATVLTGVEATEQEWTQDARRGADHLIPLLNDYRASWAIIRQWTGHDPAVAQREAEIQRLERLVWDAVYALQKAGLDREAARLRRAVERPAS